MKVALSGVEAVTFKFTFREPQKTEQVLKEECEKSIEHISLKNVIDTEGQPVQKISFEMRVYADKSPVTTETEWTKTLNQ